MGFFAPWFLAGLAAIGLPVWLHLLQQHKVDPQRFPSLQLFERRTETAVRQRRLKYRLLFLLRALMLLLLALLFAQPYIRREARAAAETRLALMAIDHSFSMRADGALERAKKMAAEEVDRLPGGQLAGLVALSSTASVLMEPTADKTELKRAIATIAPVDARNSLAELARTVKALAESRRIPLEVHLFSDVQRTSLPPAFSELALPAGTLLHIHAVAAGRPNYFVENVNAPLVVTDPRRTRVTATVAGVGTPAANKTVTLKLNGKAVATRSVTLPENGRAAVEFTGWEAPYGWTRGEVTIDGGDNLPEDDAFRFALERSDPRPVLFVYEAGRPRSALYFQAALESAADGLFMLDARSGAEVSGLDLAAYSFVVLSDVASLPAPFEESLKRYVQAGGGLLIAVAGATATRGVVPVLGTKILETRYAARTAERFFSPTQIDLAHPALARANRLEGVKVLQAVRMEGGGQVAARLSDGSPLLLDARFGEGRILTFTSGLDNLANDLPLHASFVPFVEQSARYLAQLEIRPATVTVDAFVDLRDASSRGKAAAEVINPAGQRVLTLKEAAEANSYQLSEAGFWEIVRPSKRRDLVAVNPHRAESDLTPAPADVLELWKKTGEATGGEGQEEVGRKGRKPVNLSWYVALWLLVTALAQSVVASRLAEPGAARS